MDSCTHTHAHTHTDTDRQMGHRTRRPGDDVGGKKFGGKRRNRCTIKSNEIKELDDRGQLKFFSLHHRKQIND